MDAPTWFNTRFVRITPVQRLAWPVIDQGEHIFISASTGSGKTLAALAPIITTLAREPAGGLRCLYVVPLKALANDLHKNLESCVSGISPYPPRIALRTGDTSAYSRRKIIDEPPDVLITTPESLALMLTHPGAANLFESLRWLVVDEIHSLIPNKRGADLAVSMERLDALAAKPVQRIGLSATFEPVALGAQFLVGSERRCQIVHVDGRKDVEILLEMTPTAAVPVAGSEVGDTKPLRGFLARVIRRLEPELQRSRTTLIFTDVRSLAEQLTWRLRKNYPDWRQQIAVHHSSLSFERRQAIEEQLKNGELRIVVSSASLELGIDIGSIDTVALIHAPRSVTRLLQRIGRAGHRPGVSGRALILTANANELLEGAITIASGESAQLEAMRPPQHPLDVLCQQLLGMALQGPTIPDDAFALVRQAYPYRDLSRGDFDECLAYLSGKHRDGRDWLPPRIRWDEGRFQIVDGRTGRIVRRNLGTILGEDHRTVRLQVFDANDWGDRSYSDIGQVDDDFALNLQPGDRFVLDGRCLEYQRKDGADLVVTEVFGYPLTPRWGGSLWSLPPELARRIFLYRAQAAETLRDGRPRLQQMLAADFCLATEAIAALADLFERQESVSETPDLSTCLIEAVCAEVGLRYFVHTPLNRAGNNALGSVLAQRCASTACRPTWIAGDLGLILTVEEEISANCWREVLAAENFSRDLDRAIAGSTTLRERFARIAATGLMVLRNPLGRKRRVGGHTWTEQRLFEQLQSSDPDFVLIRQAEREVRTESCDAEQALEFCAAMPRRMLRVRRLNAVSPLAENWLEPLVSVRVESVAFSGE